MRASHAEAVPVSRAPYPLAVRKRISNLVALGHRITSVDEVDPDTFIVNYVPDTAQAMVVRA